MTAPAKGSQPARPTPAQLRAYARDRIAGDDMEGVIVVRRSDMQEAAALAKRLGYPDDLEANAR